MGSADYVNMVDESGAPRLFTRAILRRKLGKIAKGKAPVTLAMGLTCMLRFPARGWTGRSSLLM